ncbi:MAG: hypothetical protein A3F33_00415 [Candidatus Woykebacteria bacterium RIFCSPHIGHO2_12_FULL_43_10]|uniref:Type II toxin-antitoxin system mRNA interferase toxin, RelE/StbE family n=2 Tax=Candidatus Woykeibacteriota TaxID=1817899 RepID=A0A1G1WXV2_9BACT|nr:MAG: hypothetical protein A3J50_02100 [Candidatus Woykebacteria bacterium RIFCSPHIGHO2_02_FULL_43_16b]OGY28876.1 MAG: hypothetical protein A3F33_00415 [Candidatus Woykebacteria bacterium RIFCSPHIGHO2_12_FULL_43_10]OGY32598.1 MAG: hypothetical protein A3A61_03740 [Candidatus Woykebacteria bacterium RIFCSPLOWO2_01_FULL_43_14]
MKIKRTPKFKRSYKERIAIKPSLVKELEDSLQLFIESPSNPLLKDHPLVEEKFGLRSFSVNQEIRIVYQKTKNGLTLYDIGTHKQVY